MKKLWHRVQLLGSSLFSTSPDLMQRKALGDREFLNPYSPVGLIFTMNMQDLVLNKEGVTPRVPDEGKSSRGIHWKRKEHEKKTCLGWLCNTPPPRNVSEVILDIPETLQKSLFPPKLQDLKRVAWVPPSHDCWLLFIGIYPLQLLSNLIFNFLNDRSTLK